MLYLPRANVELAGRHGLVNHRRIPQSIVRSALAAVIALFYSKNIVSVMIRIGLGASFSCVDHRCLVHIRMISGKARGQSALKKLE